MATERVRLCTRSKLFSCHRRRSLLETTRRPGVAPRQRAWRRSIDILASPLRQIEQNRLLAPSPARLLRARLSKKLPKLGRQHAVRPHWGASEHHRCFDASGHARRFLAGRLGGLGARGKHVDEDGFLVAPGRLYLVRVNNASTRERLRHRRPIIVGAIAVGLGDSPSGSDQARCRRGKSKKAQHSGAGA